MGCEFLEKAENKDKEACLKEKKPQLYRSSHNAKSSVTD